MASQFETIMDTKVEEKEGKLQVEAITLKDVPAHFLNLQILSGWDNFVTISKIVIEGDIVDSSNYI
jgi:hypothetical protein